MSKLSCNSLRHLVSVIIITSSGHYAYLEDCHYLNHYHFNPIGAYSELVYVNVKMFIIQTCKFSGNSPPPPPPLTRAFFFGPNLLAFSSPNLPTFCSHPALPALFPTRKCWQFYSFHCYKAVRTQGLFFFHDIPFCISAKIHCVNITLPVYQSLENEFTQKLCSLKILILMGFLNKLSFS